MNGFDPRRFILYCIHGLLHTAVSKLYTLLRQIIILSLSVFENMLESAISTVLGTLRSSLELRTLLGLTEVTGIDSRKPCNESTVARDLRRFPSLAKGMDAEPPSTSTFGLEIHPSVDRVSVEVNEYFLQHWPFRSDKERFKFRAADFPRVTCLYFPRALDERIGFACRLLTLLFLVDGKWQSFK